MASFSERSLERLNTCHPDLKRLFLAVVNGFDCAVLCGHRGEVEQDLYYATGRSQLRWPNSEHNEKPSKAVDVAPYPINWNDIRRFNYFGGYVKGVAAEKGIKIIWGGDWDNDTRVLDNNFNDLVHFQLIT